MRRADEKQCHRCGLRYPQAPWIAAAVEVESFAWTGGYPSEFPGDLRRASFNLCEFCFMVLVSAFRVPPDFADTLIGGSVLHTLEPRHAESLLGLVCADEAKAVAVCREANLPGCIRMARYLLHRAAFGDPAPAVTQAVARALSEALEAPESAWRRMESGEAAFAPSHGMALSIAAEVRLAILGLARGARLTARRLHVVTGWGGPTEEKERAT